MSIYFESAHEYNPYGQAIAAFPPDENTSYIYHNCPPCLPDFGTSLTVINNIMRILLAILFFSFSLQMSFGQACGIYKLKYVGEITSDSLTLVEVKLPTTAFLHGLEEKNADNAFRKFEISINTFDILTFSHLSCHVTASPKQLIEMYHKNRKYIPVIMVLVNLENFQVEKTINIPMEKINFIGFEYEGDAKVTIDLGNIKI